MWIYLQIKRPQRRNNHWKILKNSRSPSLHLNTWILLLLCVCVCAGVWICLDQALVLHSASLIHTCAFAWNSRTTMLPQNPWKTTTQQAQQLCSHTPLWPADTPSSFNHHVHATHVGVCQCLFKPPVTETHPEKHHAQKGAAVFVKPKQMKLDRTTAYFYSRGSGSEAETDSYRWTQSGAVEGVMDDGWTCALSFLQLCGFQPVWAAVDHAPALPLVHSDSTQEYQSNKISFGYLFPLLFFSPLPH